MTLEICVDTLASAEAAVLGGADRLEVCASLALGGLTPSPGLIQAIRSQWTLPCMMMIRPRPGNFCYTESEILLMKEEICWAKAQGLEGVVLGCLQSDGRIDRELMVMFRELADGMAFTFHRAFDVVEDPLQALETLVALRVERILSSGQATTAWEGRELLQILVAIAQGKITLVAGAGILPTNVAQLVAYTGVTEVHASAAIRSFCDAEALMLPGSSLERLLPQYQTSLELVKALKAHLG